MTKRYPGGYITKTAPTVSTTSAPGIWTMEQQAAYQKAGTWPFGGPFNYIEDVFSTYLYTGNDTTQTITNGIDLAGKGGLVWIKSRSNGTNHGLYDTQRGTNNRLSSNSSAANVSNPPFELSAFNSTGFNVGDATGANVTVNAAGYTYASWTFRKQPKFFDVVTYTGDGTSGRQIAHNLGSAPGFLVVKRTDTSSAWPALHNDAQLLYLNQAGAQAASSTTAARFGDNTSVIRPTSTVFTVGSNSETNGSGGTYVAYLFADDAGGFGLTGTDNVISCGLYSGTGNAGNFVSLGYEPQWVLIKRVSGGTGNWYLIDNMRGGLTVNGSNNTYLLANLTDAETAPTALVTANATGFTVNANGTGINGGGSSYIYIAIRRGPMKTPTSGTSVFTPQATRDATDGTASQLAWTAGFPVDMIWTGARDSGGQNDGDRLRGGTQNLILTTTDAEGSGSSRKFDSNLGIYLSGAASASSTQCAWMFRRAPGFFDVVCYTGNSTAGRQVTHNLGVAPEFMIIKRRSGVDSWYCYAQPLGNTYDLLLDSTRAASNADDIWYSTSPTSTTFTLRQYDAINGTGQTYVAYLFASCPGVSKVGNYTGTGGTQTISCGFAARFVLIKRTDSTGSWWVWDTSRGMVSGTDPRLALNSTAGEINTNWVYTDASGFQIVTTDATVNASGGSYIYLAIA